MGGLQLDATMHDRGVPYHVGESPGLDNLVLGQGNNNVKQPTLTIEPGVKILFEQKSKFHVAGTSTGAATVRAIGTAEKPIVFSSAAASPASGDWVGIFFNGKPSADNLLEHVRLEYTGADCGCILITCSAGVTEYEAAMIFVDQPAAPFLRNSVVAHGAGHGVVQSWDGAAFDWASTNTFEDLAGCPATLPREADSSCPKPKPACK